MKIKKGDTVKILTGKDRAKTGKVIKVYPKEEKVTVEGLTIYKKHVRPKRQGEKGEVVQVVRPIHFSNVALFCVNCGKAVRVGFRQEEKQKVRYCKNCKGLI